MYSRSSATIGTNCVVALSLFSATGALAQSVDTSGFVGQWAANMESVAPQQPPLKSQSYAFAPTAGGLVSKLTMEQINNGGTSMMTIDGKLLLNGSSYTGGMGETRSCRLSDPSTIRCSVAMGDDKMQETYALTSSGKGLKDTIALEEPDGKTHEITTNYTKVSSTPPSAMNVIATTRGGRVVSGNGECEVTVPAGWTTDLSMRQAASPDYGVEVHIVTRPYASNMQNLAELKALNAAAYKPVKTFEDTAKRVWIQYAPHSENNNGWYVALLGKTGTCELDIGFKNSVIPNAAVAKAIAASLRRLD